MIIEYIFCIQTMSSRSAFVDFAMMASMIIGLHKTQSYGFNVEDVLIPMSTALVIASKKQYVVRQLFIMDFALLYSAHKWNLNKTQKNFKRLLCDIAITILFSSAWIWRLLVKAE